MLNPVVPFPILHHQEPSATPAFHPSSDYLWHGTPGQSQYLRHDATPASQKLSQSPDHSSQPHTPLTPPLTPASSSNDNINSSTPSEPASPFATRWSQSIPDTRHSARMPSQHCDAQINLTCDIGVDRSSDPKATLNFDLPQVDADVSARRFLLVDGVPKDASSNALKDAFKACGDIKGIHVRFQVQHGAVIIAFFDSRHAVHAKHLLSSQVFFGDSWLNARYISPAELRKLLGNSAFVSETEGEVLVTVDRGRIDNAPLQSVLRSFGELRAFRQANVPQKQAFYAEFFDSRDAVCALDALNSRTILGIRLRLTLNHPDMDTNVVPFPKPKDQSPHAPSHHTPSETSSSFSTPSQSFNNSHSEVHDMTNSSPFISQRPLSSPSPPIMNRRISTGSYNPTSPSLHQSTSEQDLRRKAAAQESGATRPEPHVRRTSNVYGFDAIRRTLGHAQTPTQPLAIRSRANSESSASPVNSSKQTQKEEHHAQEEPSHEPTAVPVLTPLQILPPSTPHAEQHTYITHHTHSHPHMHAQQAHPAVFPVSPVYWAGDVPQLMTPALPSVTPHSHYISPATSPHALHFLPSNAYASRPPRILQHPQPQPLHQQSHQYQNAHTLAHLPTSARGVLDVLREPPAERNQIDLGRIADGVDTRTTVMIKNIPNKLSDRDLIDFIGKVCPRKIDFLYLRMDFQNGCNVGYAFVNFIKVQDLLRFAQTKLGVKWNMFSSEKVLQMSYANYQGKEALVEKFKNSCVMDERESWRPKIFYSSGARQGLPEPFPSPTHLRRKERSSQNRGALFVPGPQHASSGGGNDGQNSSNSHPSFRRPNQHPAHLARSENHY